MSRLDEDLAKAAGSEAPEANDPPPVVRRAARRAEASPETRGNRALLGLLVVVGLGLIGLVFSFKDAAIYAKTVDQLMADKTRLAGRAVRVEGNLVKGSLVHQEQPCEYRFRIAEKGAEVPVRYANCVVPDTFRDVPGMDVRVTVEGKLSTDDRFEATQVMAKCPSKYEMKQRAGTGEAAPHQTPSM